MQHRTLLGLGIACAFFCASNANAAMIAKRGPQYWPKHHAAVAVRGVAVPSLPVPMPAIIKAGCPGLEDEVVGCAIGVNEADVYGHVYPTGAVFTNGDRFTTAHELGHAFDATRMDASERDLFAILVERNDVMWSSTYTADNGLLVQRPDSLAEVFADAYANCRLHHVVKSGRVWEAGYDYYPTQRQHLKVCRLIRRAGLDAGTPAVDGYR